MLIHTASVIIRLFFLLANLASSTELLTLSNHLPTPYVISMAAIRYTISHLLKEQKKKALATSSIIYLNFCGVT
jgi:hypothetical protein